MESGWPAVRLYSARWTKPPLARLPGCCCQVAEAGQPRCKLTMTAPLQQR